MIAEGMLATRESIHSSCLGLLDPNHGGTSLAAIIILLLLIPGDASLTLSLLSQLSLSLTTLRSPPTPQNILFDFLKCILDLPPPSSITSRVGTMILHCSKAQQGSIPNHGTQGFQ